jgi:hypothetical protein
MRGNTKSTVPVQLPIRRRGTVTPLIQGFISNFI